MAFQSNFNAYSYLIVHNSIAIIWSKWVKSEPTGQSSECFTLQVHWKCFCWNFFHSDILQSVLGLPSECTHNNVIRSCTLSFSCWIQGGHHVEGCGGNKWLFSCCISDGDTMDFNSAAISPFNGLIKPGNGFFDMDLPARLNLMPKIKSQLMPSTSSSSSLSSSSMTSSSSSLYKKNMLRRRMDDNGMVRRKFSPFFFHLLLTNSLRLILFFLKKKK